MSRKPASAPGEAPQRRAFFRRRWLQVLGLLLLALLLLPILQIGCVRWVNPPLTTLMLQRSAQSSAQRQYQWVALSRIPRDFLQCALISEDQRFFLHHGFDWKEIVRARQQAQRSGKPARGASTISMQCARSLFLWQGRSWVRKALEAYYTFWMEALLPKRRILELYCNVIEMGENVFGIEAAAQAHYSKSALGLTRSQCAMLVAILPSPRTRDPRHPSPALILRQQHILNEAARHPVALPW